MKKKKKETGGKIIEAIWFIKLLTRKKLDRRGENWGSSALDKEMFVRLGIWTSGLWILFKKSPRNRPCVGHHWGVLSIPRA